jgi:hypothetical protein
MMFGAWGEPDHDKSVAIIHRALDAGINFIDTADVYSQGESEIIVGQALADGRRDGVVLATKVHRPDPDTDIEETLAPLTDLQRAGKIRAFGSLAYPAYQMVQAQWTARERGLGRFVTEQPPYSLLVRGVEADVLPAGLRLSRPSSLWWRIDNVHPDEWDWAPFRAHAIVSTRYRGVSGCASPPTGRQSRLGSASPPPPLLKRMGTSGWFMSRYRDRCWA